jgi:hypothetical protein
VPTEGDHSASTSQLLTLLKRLDNVLASDNQLL